MPQERFSALESAHYDRLGGCDDATPASAEPPETATLHGVNTETLAEAMRLLAYYGGEYTVRLEGDNDPWQITGDTLILVSVRDRLHGRSTDYLDAEVSAVVPEQPEQPRELCVRYAQEKPGVWRYYVIRPDGHRLAGPYVTRETVDRKVDRLLKAGWQWAGK